MNRNSRMLKLVPLLLLAAMLLAACNAAAAPTPTPTPAPKAAVPVSEGFRTFVIVPTESKVSYHADEEFLKDALRKYGIKAGRQDTVGSTSEIQGQLQLNLNDLSAPLGTNEFTVDLTTLKSDQSLRDGWIKKNGPKFGSFPTATFVATGVSEAPDSYTEGEEVTFKLSGDLTIREITKPATFEVTAKLEGDTLTGVAMARLLMSDFGFDPPNFANTLTVKDEFGLEVQFTAREQ